jgi:hypothetical protein
VLPPRLKIPSIQDSQLQGKASLALFSMFSFVLEQSLKPAK